MPDTTPIYGFPYPCPGDPVTAADFAALATAIDTKLLDVFNDEDFALNRYNVRQQMLPAQAGIAAAVETPLVNAGSSYVTPVAGIYMVAVETLTTATANIASCRTRVTLNTVPVFGKSFNNEPDTGSARDYTISSGPIVAAAGDTIGTTFIFFGTGTVTVNLDLDVSLIVRIA